MRLIGQTKLFYKKGTSDKVYEIDLCEAGEGEFIINFRYGRRGASLKEGTKTPFPENRSKAEAIFSKLVSEKKAKGYQTAEESGAAPAKPIPVQKDAPPSSSDPRTLALLARLKKGYSEDAWKLSRAIWRAGKWQIGEALPLLRDLTAGAKGMDAWCLAWALGRCGDSTDVPALQSIAAANPKETSLQNIAREAILTHLGGEERSTFLASIRKHLPPQVLAEIETQDSIQLASKLRELIHSGDTHKHLTADLFLLSKSQPHIREALHSLSKTVSTSKNGMLVLRQLFKAAEFRLDAEIYGATAKRFETDSPNHYGHPFTSRTRLYFKRRIHRHLEEAGREGDASTFITLATGILLAYDDTADNPTPGAKTDYGWDPQIGRSTYTTIHLPPRHDSHSLQWLLRGSSSALKVNKKSLTWQFIGEASPAASGDEVFPHLWNAAPEAISYLLTSATAAEVQDFALRVWDRNPSFAENPETSFIIQLLGSWYSETATLGLSLAKQIWSPREPDAELLLAALESESAEARQTGSRWLGDIRHSLPGFPKLLLRLAFARHDSSREAIRSTISTTILSSAAQKDFIASVISGLLTLGEDDSSQATFTVEILRLLADRELEKLPVDHISALLTHPLETLQILATRILTTNRTPASLPEEILLAPLSSPFASVRELGLTLLGKLTDHQLAERSGTLAACALSSHPDLREHTLPLISRIASHDREFASDLVLRTYPLILRKESHEGLHADLFLLLSGPLEKALTAIPGNSYPRMLASEYARAQALGFILLEKEADLHSIDFPLLRDWATHPHAALRHHIWNHFSRYPDVLRSNISNSLPLLESTWPDCSEKAFTYCREKFAERDWTPEALIAICDSTRPLVRDFGREMITRRFREEDGPLYLAHLSQHPSTDLQIFASNYLMRFAAGHPNRIAMLVPYFRTVLSKIGAGRTAKERIYTLFEKEALADPSVASLVAEMLTRISATIAIGDKARCMDLLRKISHHWPDIPSPLTVTAPPLRQPETV